MTYHKEEYTLHNGKKIYAEYNEYNICQVSKECMEMLLDLYQQGRVDAIDDFADKLNAKCSGMIKDKWNSNVAPISWAEAYANFKEDIDEIAEKLKKGKS